MKKIYEIKNEVAQEHGYASYLDVFEFTYALCDEVAKRYAAQFVPQWIKINSEADLPASGDACWFMLKDRSFYPGFYRSDGRVFICGEKKYHISVVTRYAPITKPRPPKED